MGKCFRQKDQYLIYKNFLLGKARSFKTRIRVRLLLISPFLYYYLNEFYITLHKLINEEI